MWEAVLENLRWADLLDVVLVAVFVYFILNWLSARSSRGILAASLILAVCYALTLWLDLYLTRTLFQAGFVFLLLAVVVILQQDIRRGFERLATLRLGRAGNHNGDHDETTAGLIEAVIEMSEQRTGALLVFPGREPLTRFTHGGVRLDALISPTLLHSIFSCHSPGHDGAALVQADRIEQVGVHLPLSTNLEVLGAGGTRHAAALGLAERCDALVLVVSEERGTVSVAQHGQLREIAAGEIDPLLTAHLQSQGSKTDDQPAANRIMRRAGLKLASLGIAITLWSIFAFRVDQIQRNYVIPIEYRNLPGDLVVDRPSANYVRLTLSGSERVISKIDFDGLVVSFDLASAQQGQTLRLSTRDGIGQLPGDIDILDVDPRQITLSVERRDAAAADPAPSGETP